MKKVDFREIEIENVDGSKMYIDLSKEIGNRIGFNADRIEIAELGKNIGKYGEIELSDDEVDVIKKISNLFSSYVIRTALIELLK